MKMNWKKIFCILASLTAVSVYAQDDLLGDFGGSSDITGDIGTTSSSSEATDFELSLTGDHIAEFHAPVQKDHMDMKGEIKSPKFTNDLGIMVNYKSIKLVSQWALDITMNDSGDIAKMISATPLENAVYWSPWKFKFGAGFQYFTWGSADKINPTDNINPRDYRYGADSEKLSVLSASVNVYPTDWFSMEGVYVPFEQRDYFPKDSLNELMGKDTMFARKSVSTGMSNTDLGTLTAASDTGSKALLLINLSKLNGDYNKNVTYNWADYDYKNFVAGGKFNFFTSVLDMSFSYLYDIDSFWTPEIDLVKQDMSQLLFAQSILAGTPNALIFTQNNQYSLVESIKLERRRVHRFGADFKKTIDRFGIWLEACYSMTDDYTNSSYKIRNDKLDWTLGTDFTFGPDGRFYTNIQYAGNWVVGFDDKFYKDYEDGLPDATKYSDTDYMEEYYYRAITNKLGSHFAGLNQGLTVNMKFPFLNDMITPEITVGYMLPLLYDTSYETKYGAALIKPELDIMPFDSFHIIIGADLYYAWHKYNDKSYVEFDTETDRIGMFTNDNSVYIMAQYKWGFDLKK